MVNDASGFWYAASYRMLSTDAIHSATTSRALCAPEIFLGRTMSSLLPLVSLPCKCRVIRNRLCLMGF